MENGYLHYFNTNDEFTSAYTGEEYKEPWVSYVRENENVNYNRSLYERMLSTPLTFEILSGGNIGWYVDDEDSALTIEYCKNGGEWTSITATTEGTLIPVNAGDILRFRGNNGAYTFEDGNLCNMFNDWDGTLTTAVFNVYGNIMSLVYGDNFSGQTTLVSSYTFCYLFESCTGLISAENLMLPATVLTNDCYGYMFEYCTNLTAAPSSLPATVLKDWSYVSMFSHCSSLISAPELPATTLGSGCCYGMFEACTGLTTAPSILPATTLVDSCYRDMFNGCTSLTTAPELPATTLAPYCYHFMFNACTSLTTAPELPATTLGNYCCGGMFYACTGLTTGPSILPAMTLVENCYRNMFYSCVNLTRAPELPATTLVPYCYNNMFYSCAKLNYIKCLATNISATQCTTGWVTYVQTTASGTFVKHPSMTSWTRGNNGIPDNWTVQDAS